MTTMDGKLLLIGVLAQIEVANIDCFGKNIHEYSSSLTEAMKFHSQKYLIMAFIITNKTSCTGPKENGRGSPKKSCRKVIKMGSDEEEEMMAYDKESMDVDIKIKIPSRKLPYRQARATKFVEQSSDAEDEQEEEEGDVKAEWKI
ncbi:hypothetical protein MFRU_003g04190 [Monilinia fructicola]|uniref:Uncharacterized protein n=1 Tax=Monilinia fructicola TaxID=38448 RepID=A0A5M9JXA1_MONFR|nr:hypothetical protein EYC84_002975 [Monilinia fructicola]KAG4034456.1 hypothetical protein MFRU_003g04190 [Monilinia fructicola]